VIERRGKPGGVTEGLGAGGGRRIAGVHRADGGAEGLLDGWQRAESFEAEGPLGNAGAGADDGPFDVAALAGGDVEAVQPTSFVELDAALSVECERFGGPFGPKFDGDFVRCESESVAGCGEQAFDFESGFFAAGFDAELGLAGVGEVDVGAVFRSGGRRAVSGCVQEPGFESGGFGIGPKEADFGGEEHWAILAEPP
jgi:hypothetical protein